MIATTAVLEAEWDWEVIKGLLPLTELFENPETVGLLTELARHFDHYPALPQDIKFKVLCALVDTASPRQPVEFWSTIHQQNPGPARVCSSTTRPPRAQVA